MECSYLAILLITLVGAASSYSHQLKVMWDEMNPIFRMDNTDHVMDVHIGDIMEMVCSNHQYHIIYMVNEEEYQSCRIHRLNGLSTRKLLTCRPPRHPNSPIQRLTLTVRSFSPVPRGVEFVPGQRYYFISTSDGTLPGLHKQDGGSCSRYNMKLILNVKERDNNRVMDRKTESHPPRGTKHRRVFADPSTVDKLLSPWTKSVLNHQPSSHSSPNSIQSREQANWMNDQPARSSPHKWVRQGENEFDKMMEWSKDNGGEWDEDVVDVGDEYVAFPKPRLLLYGRSWESDGRSGVNMVKLNTINLFFTILLSVVLR